MESQQLFNSWINSISKSEIPEPNIIAYNFGIFESEDGFTVYLIGSTEFDDDDSDWACNEDFVPKEKHFTFPQEDFLNISWEIALERISTIINNFIDSDDFKNSFLANAKAITTGFDDGDLIRLK